MTIESLEQQLCEDCISRKEVNVLVDELARAISDERCFISRGRSTAAILQDILDLPSVTPKYTDDNEALELAIKALEQTDVLDKIRAKIEKLQKMCDTNDLNLLSQYSAFGMALDVIDEYKAESEDGKCE